MKEWPGLACQSSTLMERHSKNIMDFRDVSGEALKVYYLRKFVVVERVDAVHTFHHNKLVWGRRPRSVRFESYRKALHIG